MAKLLFFPCGTELDVEPGTKVLAAAIRNKVKIRYGCASCRCGTCAVRVAGGELQPMRDNERELLARMGLDTSGTIRLACQTRVVGGTVEIDLAFQSTYSPDQLEGDDDP